MATRPFFQSSIEDLETLFAERSEDIGFLKSLTQELSLRKTKRARRLLDLALVRLLEAPNTNGWVEPNVSGDDLPVMPKDLNSSVNEEIDEDIRAGDANAYGPKLQTSGTASIAQPPDDRKRPEHSSRIRPLGTPGLPEPWVPALRSDRQLDISANADLPQIYVAALTALIAEIKTTGAGQKRYELENGVRTQSEEIVYEFPFTDEAELFEDANVEVEISGQRVHASIVSINSGRLFLALETDYGGVLERVVLLVDATALLAALKQRIEENSKGEIILNRTIADAVVGKQKPPADPTPISKAVSDTKLDFAQSKALQRALSASVTYIWGPPGCGKTRVLGEIVRSGFEAGKRILVCSNTNKAVDQVLYTICNSLGEEHRAMEDGRIVRLGTIADEKLRIDYNAYVTIDGIVERRSADLKARVNQIQEEIGKIDRQAAKARAILDQFVQLDKAQKTVNDQIEAFNKLARISEELSSEFQSLDAKLRALSKELDNRRNAVFGFFHRSEQTIQQDISATQARRAKLPAEIESTKAQHSEALTKYALAKREHERIVAMLGGVDRSLPERIIAAADKSRAPLVAELREIEVKIGELRTSIVKEAKVLGATCTKTYLTVKEIGQVDTIIVDEASMVLLPVAWFVSGLAKERVVVCGDFRQIPPILQTSQQAVYDVLGPDVFTAVGLAVDDPRMDMLTTQYRMDEAICGLISEPMYESLLNTAAEKNGHQTKQRTPAPYDGALTIIDTSDLWPFESVNAFKSRFNLMHALLARNLAWHFNQTGYIQSNTDLAICSPYAAQSRLIRKLIDGEGLGSVVQVGTVHSFQGDERNAILLELPESYGGARMLGQFLQGIPPKQIGARLINVAVSRAQNHLIILANLTHLDRSLPSSSFLRGILYDMQENGRVIPGSDVLKLRPIENDLRGLFDRVPLDIDAKTMGIFNQSTFNAAIEADLSDAITSIVILSGFVTPARVAKLGDLLRMKTLEGVKVRCVTRPPKLNGTLDPALGKEALDGLEKMGCVVDCRARIHEKIVIIDKEVVWHGSLNVLSHTHRTDESMTRIVNAGFAGAIAANITKRRVSMDKALLTIGEAENPRCEQCGARTVYNEGKFGPYFYCEDDCGWTVNLKNNSKKSYATGSPQKNSDLAKEGPACPMCGGKTALRNGKYGAFYGCLSYPKCKGTSNASGPSKKSKQ